MRRLPRTLDPIEIRVLGSLLEKEQATPAYYPMTVNSVRQACNQKTNRSPVMSLSEREVQAALDRLFNEDVFAWRSRSGRTTKWKHNVDRRWRLQAATKAVMTLLLLRGPQTPGELRSRADRLHAFADLAEVEQALESLTDGEDPLVRELPRQPGQKENRWTHLVGDDSADIEATVQADGTSTARTDQTPSPQPSSDARLARLEDRVERLERLMAKHLPGEEGQE